MEKYTIERIINIIHCEIRLADDTGHLLERFGNLPENEDPFCTDPSFLRACLDREALPLPDIFCENTYIYYARLSLPDRTSLLAGPVRIIRESHDMASQMAAAHGIQVSPLKLPFCEENTFLNGILLLYHSVTGREISMTELCSYHGFPADELDLARKELNSLVFSTRNLKFRIIPYSHEARKLKSIEDGSPEQLKKMSGRGLGGQAGKGGRHAFEAGEKHRHHRDCLSLQSRDPRRAAAGTGLFHGRQLHYPYGTDERHPADPLRRPPVRGRVCRKCPGTAKNPTAKINMWIWQRNMSTGISIPASV